MTHLRLPRCSLIPSGPSPQMHPLSPSVALPDEPSTSVPQALYCFIGQLCIACSIGQPCIACSVGHPRIACSIGRRPALCCLKHPRALHYLIVTPSTAAYFLALFVGAVNLAQTTQEVPVSPVSAAALHLPHPLLPVPYLPPSRHSLPPPATPVPLILRTPLLVTSYCCRLPQLQIQPVL